MADWSISVPISKVDAEKRQVFGWASVVTDESGAAIVDKQGDIIPVDELERAAYGYVLKSREGADMHERRAVSDLIESVVLTAEKREAMGVPAGPCGWWVGYQVQDAEAWAAIKSGDRSEFSIGGRATPEEAAA